MSRIAACAGVSKGTLYNYFAGKAELFSAWVAQECESKLAHLFEAVDPDGQVATGLLMLGERMIRMMMSPTGLTIYRMTVAEAAKFPVLARAFYDAGAVTGDRVHRRMAGAAGGGGQPWPSRTRRSPRSSSSPCARPASACCAARTVGRDRRADVDPGGGWRRHHVPQHLRSESMTAALDSVLAHIEAGLDGTRGRWFDLLRIPSVSAQPAHRADCAAAAEWLRANLAAIGFEAAVLPTAGHPVVLAHHRGTQPGPRLLYYGHYDVQPAEPLELWTSPPFEPVLSEGPRGPRIAARGAVDDKGQVMMWLEALRGWHEVAGGPPCR